MRQLTSLDAQFLALETPRIYGHVTGVLVLDPSTAPGGTLTVADLQNLILERLPLIPIFKWRLAEVPFGIDFAYWVDDPDFDIDFHVRELALVPPGSTAQLEEQVARIFSRPLDRSRPLWEIYLIHGLEHGRVALMTKVHHAVIDGLSGAEILGSLLDLTPEGRPAPAPAQVDDGPQHMPSQLEMLGRGLAGIPQYPLRLLRSLPAALPHFEEVGIFSILPGAGVVGAGARRLQAALRRSPIVNGRKLSTPPHTSFNGRISAHRRIVFGQLPLDTVKAVKNRHGVTVNDVVVSICAGAVRRWLQHHRELGKQPLIAQIPVSVRSPEQQGTFGNRILLMGVALHTEIADPVDRLRATSESLAEMKERNEALPASLLQDANNFIPPALFTRAAQLTYAWTSNPRLRPTWNLVVSNVPGPQIPLYCAGALLEAIYPVSVIMDGLGLNITVMSYKGSLDIGIVADRDVMPDVGTMIRWLADELEALDVPDFPERPAHALVRARRHRSRTPAKPRPA
ncbi:MAG: wax ester/triacylglycerol synthase family O-acyltransferase [Candidatus Dormibacteria bacterium]